MILILIAVLSIIIALIRKGSFSNLFDNELKASFLFILAIIIFVALKVGDGVPVSVIQAYSFFIMLAGYIVLLLAIIINFNNVWMIPLLLGTILNFIVIFFNKGYMPISESAMSIAKVSADVISNSSVMKIADASTTLPFLGGIIPIPLPGFLAEVVSPGTILIGLGMFGVLQNLMMGIVYEYDDEDEDEDEEFDDYDENAADKKKGGLFSSNSDDTVIESKTENDIDDIEYTKKVGNLNDDDISNIEEAIVIEPEISNEDINIIKSDDKESFIDEDGEIEDTLYIPERSNVDSLSEDIAREENIIQSDIEEILSNVDDFEFEDVIDENAYDIPNEPIVDTENEATCIQTDDNSNDIHSDNITLDEIIAKDTVLDNYEFVNDTSEDTELSITDIKDNIQLPELSETVGEASEKGSIEEILDSVNIIDNEISDNINAIGADTDENIISAAINDGYDDVISEFNSDGETVEEINEIISDVIKEGIIEDIDNVSDDQDFIESEMENGSVDTFSAINEPIESLDSIAVKTDEDQMEDDSAGDTKIFDIKSYKEDSMFDMNENADFSKLVEDIISEDENEITVDEEQNIEDDAVEKSEAIEEIIDITENTVKVEEVIEEVESIASQDNQDESLTDDVLERAREILSKADEVDNTVNEPVTPVDVDSPYIIVNSRIVENPNYKFRKGIKDNTEDEVNEVIRTRVPSNQGKPSFVPSQTMISDTGDNNEINLESNNENSADEKIINQNKKISHQGYEKVEMNIGDVKIRFWKKDN